jgi:putative peptidoglycan lipid II flippase
MAEGDRRKPDVVHDSRLRGERGTVYRSAAARGIDAPPAAAPATPPAAAPATPPATPLASPPSALPASGPDDVAAVATASSAPDEPGGSAASNSAVMAVGSLVSRGTGFLRTLVITAAVGTAVGDAYTTAQIFPGMIYEFLIGGILTSVLVPVLVRRRKADPDRGEAYTQRLLTLAVLALGAATVIAVLAAPLLTALYTSDRTTAATSDLITALSRLMLPMIFFTGLSALLGAVLNTRGHFAAPMWSPILNNLVVIGTFGLFIALIGVRDDLTAEQMSPARIALIGGGTLLGVMVQAAGLVPALRRVGFRWRWRGQFRSLGLGELARLGAWMFCYVAVSQIGLVVLFKLANAASAEKQAGPLIYNNVFLLIMMAHGIVAVSIITALMPRMSAASADGRYADLAADLSRGTRMVTAVLAPIAVCYAVLAAPIAVTLFRWGAFTAENAAATSLVLVMAALALVPFAISQLFTFAFYALPDTKTPALINIPVVALRVLVQIGLFAAFAAEFTAAGLMIGNGVSYVVAAVVSAWLLRGRVGRLAGREIAVTTGKVLVAALGAALVGLVVDNLLPGDATPTKVEAIVRLVVGGAAIAASYLGLAMALRIHEINEVVGLVRRKLGR